MAKNVKKKLIVDRYENEIYPNATLYVVKNGTYENLKKTFNLEKDEFDGNYDACLFSGVKNLPKDETCYVVLLDNSMIKRDALYKLGVCTHEAMHYVIRLMTDIEMKINVVTGEACCYLQEWATKCIYRTLSK